MDDAETGGGGGANAGGGGIDDESLPTTSSSFQPMAVESSTATDAGNQKNSSSTSSWSDWFQKSKGRHGLPPRYQLVTDTNARAWSLWSLRFAVLAAAINTKMLTPNYPIMVSPDIHPDSFPDTDPFDFNSATYFIPMCSLLGVAISSIFIGQISDKMGRKKMILILAVVSGGGSIVKYFSSNNFWPFCITNFTFGLFLGNLPVAMAYVGDVFVSKHEKEDQLGTIVGCYVVGNSGGGIIAILMTDSGLFAPLWVGAGIMFASAIFTFYCMIEPGDARLNPIGKNALLEQNKDDDDDEGEAGRPDTIDQAKLWNVVGGALADNVGSTSLMPLCLSPLAIEAYLVDFVTAIPPEEPIMTINGYKWLSVMVAVMVVPSTLITPRIFAKIGVAATCVLGNCLTALLTFALLMIGNAPPTELGFAFFVAVLYGGFPFTVFSQLTTGPMLDILAPDDKIGYVQGLNNAAMNFGMALAPWVFGILADAAGTNTAIWIGIGVSLLAALINSPLMFDKRFGRAVKKPPLSKRVLSFEENKELVQQALDGELIPAEDLFAINHERIMNRKSLIVAKVKPYEDDKDDLDTLYRAADETFRFRMSMQDRFLAEVADPNREKDVAELCEMLNVASGGSDEEKDAATKDLGQWIGDYLKDNGYHPHFQSLVVKQMILSAFPPLRKDKEYTPENIEDSLVRGRQVMNEYLKVRERRKYSVSKLLGNGGTQQFYA